jgi:hypothetical protein
MADPADHIVSAPFRSTRIDGVEYWHDGPAWGQTEDQPKYLHVVTAGPTDADRRAGFYRVRKTPFLLRTRDGRNPDENMAAIDALSKLGAVRASETAPLFRLPAPVGHFDERLRSTFATARAWVAEKLDRERQDREDRREREEADHARAVRELPPGTPVTVVFEGMLPMFSTSVLGVFERWSEERRRAVVRVRPPGRKRRGLYLIPAENIRLK